MIKVASAPLNRDLSQFSRWLTGQGLPHRITEEEGQQAIYLASDQYGEEVEKALALYLSDQDFKSHIDQTQPVWRVARESQVQTAYPRAMPQQAPVIYAVIGLSVLIAWLTGFGQGGALLRSLLILDPFSLDADLSTMSGRWFGLIESLANGDLWRLITPDFLHFSLMHITFNLLMLWVLGGQLEIQKGSWAFINLAIFVSVFSNVAQFLDTGYLFGGMSGVVYGLIGYCWVWRRYDESIFLPEPIFRFSLVWLLIGYTPLTETLGWGQMANSAHLYGLLSGGVWGLISIGSKKARRG